MLEQKVRILILRYFIFAVILFLLLFLLEQKIRILIFRYNNRLFINIFEIASRNIFENASRICFLIIIKSRNSFQLWLLYLWIWKLLHFAGRKMQSFFFQLLLQLNLKAIYDCITSRVKCVGIYFSLVVIRRVWIKRSNFLFDLQSFKYNFA